MDGGHLCTNYLQGLPMTLSVGLVSGPVFSEGEDGEVLLASAMHIPTSSGKQMVQGKHLPKICFKAQLYE